MLFFASRDSLDGFTANKNADVVLLEGGTVPFVLVSMFVVCLFVRDFREIGLVSSTRSLSAPSLEDAHSETPGKIMI